MYVNKFGSGLLHKHNYTIDNDNDDDEFKSALQLNHATNAYDANDKQIAHLLEPSEADVNSGDSYAVNKRYVEKRLSNINQLYCSKSELKEELLNSEKSNKHLIEDCNKTTKTIIKKLNLQIDDVKFLKDNVVIRDGESYDAKGRKIRNLLEPEFGNDAVTKNYVDVNVKTVENLINEKSDAMQRSLELFMENRIQISHDITLGSTNYSINKEIKPINSAIEEIRQSVETIKPMVLKLWENVMKTSNTFGDRDR